MSHVGVLIVTHGGAGLAMLRALRVLVGPAAEVGFDAISIEPGEAREQIAERIAGATTRLDQGAGVLIVADLHGSTPANCGMELKRAGWQVEVLCGLSLPMLIKLASTDRAGTTPVLLARLAADTAYRSIRLGGGEVP